MDYKTQIAEIFDHRAPEYGNFGTHYFDIFAHRLISIVPAFAGAQVLDVATGRGAILKRVQSQIGKEGRIIGIDLSSKMIEITRKEIEADNVSFFCMDADTLDFAESSFDLIYCGFALFFFPDIQKVLKEFKRVLKPRGKIAISTWGEIAKTRRILKEKLVFFAIDPLMTARPMPSKSELHEFFEEAGFNAIEVVSDHLDHLYLNFDHWMECLSRHSMYGELKKLNEEQLSLLKIQLCEELAHENRSDGFHEHLNVLYTTASN